MLGCKIYGDGYLKEYVFMKRIIAALLLSILVVGGLTAIAFLFNSRVFSCVILWHTCLIQLVIHTPENSVNEASLIDVFGFLVGTGFGILVYTWLIYVLLRRGSKINSQKKLSERNI
jgi:hypothetical protein